MSFPAGVGKDRTPHGGATRAQVGSELHLEDQSVSLLGDGLDSHPHVPEYRGGFATACGDLLSGCWDP